MAQRPVAGKGRYALILLIVGMLLGGCAASPDRETRSGSPTATTTDGWVSVQRGDTLGKIAHRGDVPLARLQRFNPQADTRRLAVGQRLLMPTQRERAPSGGPYRYEIRPGDTYSSIARQLKTHASRIERANPGIPPTALRIGQIIQVPVVSGTSRSATSRNASPSTPASPAKASSAPAARSAPGKLPGKARDWPWPMDDYRVVRAFGTDSRGTLQPMLLAGGKGSQAKSVAAGEVRFADSMRQLGQVVIVHHPDNLQSVYALCEEPLVGNGDRVERGTPVCEVGYSTSTERYDLLFDLRQGGKPIDPRKVLR